ncbi:uncharacterized protein [Anabrus simplex]|uniref:uncharacterized protein n=1 Tax=Anabrus simplex TaxID=316456 RepID=UPI0035A283AA
MAVVAVVGLFLAAAIPSTLASCNGYNMTVQQIVSCKDSVIEFRDNKLILEEVDNKCFLKVVGPIIINNDFDSAKVTLQVSRGGVPVINAVHDMCNRDRDIMAQHLAALGYTCPMSKGVITPDPVDITSHVNMLQMMRGVWIINADARHDVGKSCVKAQIKITK